MAFRLCRPLSVLALTALVLWSSVEPSAAGSWRSRHAPTAAPEAWTGTADGIELLMLRGRLGRHAFGIVEHTVAVNGNEIRFAAPDGVDEWTGTLEERQWQGGWWPPTRVVDFDDVSRDSVEAYLAARLADMSDATSADELSVAVRELRVEIGAGSGAGDLFVVWGWVDFRVSGFDGSRPQRGLYVLRSSGVMEEVIEEPEPPMPQPTRVLLLGDGGSEGAVEAALIDAGYDVTTFGDYRDWYGVTPGASEFDAVVYLDGIVFGEGLTAEADAALAQFVADGGGLVRTEWSVWSGAVNPGIDPLLPLEPSTDFRYGDLTPTSWTVVLPGHPLTEGVDPVWEEPGGIVLSNPVPGATVAVETHDGWPVVTMRTDAGGPVIHVNHALGYRGIALGPNVIRLLVNAVGVASGS